jgi:pimeloyl-ACP methyl ester carboxylesterase
MTGNLEVVGARTWGVPLPECGRVDERAGEIRDQEVDLGGSRIHYLTAGDGLPLVMLHGAGESALDWQWVMPALARRFRMIAPDLPGFGKSDRPRADYSPAFFGDFVAGLLDALHIPRAVVVGNSLGGLAALRFALAAQERVLALVLVDSVGLGREIIPGIKWLLPWLVSPGSGEWVAYWAMTSLGKAQLDWWRTQLQFARPERAPVEWIAEQHRLSRRTDFVWNSLDVLRAFIDLAGQRDVLRDRLPDLMMPTLILWGEHDRVIPISHARDAVGRLRRGRLALIPDCGHQPQVERPDLFLEALNPFLDETMAGVESDGRLAGRPS